MKSPYIGVSLPTNNQSPFSPLFETAVRRTDRGWCLSSMGPNQGRTSVTRWSLFGHSRPLISSDKPPNLSIDSNHRQHTTQAVIEGQLTFWRGKQCCPGAEFDALPRDQSRPDFQSIQYLSWSASASQRPILDNSLDNSQGPWTVDHGPGLLEPFFGQIWISSGRLFVEHRFWLLAEIN